MMSSPERSLHILIVEDNRTQAEYLRHLLEKRGHMVSVSNNGYEALERLSEKRPDIILTDVMMPDMDGFTLCKKVKQDEKTSEIPIILVTHLYSPVDVIKGLEAGADNFIIKPYDPDYIFSRIASIIQAQDHPQTKENIQPLDVVFSSEVHTIASSRMQILNILLSTYETAVKNNSELQVAHERLHYTNAQLQKLVEDLEQTNESLHLKNLERGRLESALHTATEKIDVLSSALKHILHTQVQTACEILDEQKETEPVGTDDIRKVQKLMKDCNVAMHHSRQFLKTGTALRTWHQVRNLINESIGPMRLSTIRYENLIPEDIEVYADPCIRAIFSSLISALHMNAETPGELRFSFHVRENGYSFVLENTGRGIPDEDKERIFSVEEGLNTMPYLYLVREMLATNNLSIGEVGKTDHGARYVIACPESSIRFASDIQNTGY